jgi:hypothetical protein
VGVDQLQAHPGAAFVSGHYRRIDAEGEISYEPDLPKVGSYHYKELLRRNYVAMHGTVMYRQGALNAVGGFDETLTACEDWDVYLRIARRFPVCRHQELVAEYRYHHGNMSRDPGRMLMSVLEVLGTQTEVVKGRPDLEEALRDGIAWHRDYYGLDGIGSLTSHLTLALSALRRHDPDSHREVAARRRVALRPGVRPATVAEDTGE